jgi:tetratricopeptide (TPR) repeat protein
MLENLTRRRLGRTIVKPARLKAPRTSGIAVFSMMLAFGSWAGQTSHAQADSQNPAMHSPCENEPALILEISDNREDLNVWHKLAMAELKIGNADGAEASFERMRSIGERSGDKAAVATAMQEIGKRNRFRFLLDWMTRQTSTGAGLLKLELPEKYERKMAHLQELSDHVHDLFQNAIAIDKELNRTSAVVSGYANLAALYNIYDPDDPMVEMLLQQAIAIGEAAKLEEEMGGPYLDMGNVHLRRGAYDEAERLYKLALALSAKSADPEYELASIEHLVKLYAVKNDNEQVEAMRKRGEALRSTACFNPKPATVIRDAAEVLKHERILGHDVGVAGTLSIMGRLNGVLNNLDQAEANYQEALSLNQRLGRKIESAAVYANLASLSMTRENKAKACEYWLLAEQNDPASTYYKKVKQEHGCSG